MRSSVLSLLVQTVQNWFCHLYLCRYTSWELYFSGYFWAFMHTHTWSLAINNYALNTVKYVRSISLQYLIWNTPVLSFYILHPFLGTSSFASQLHKTKTRVKSSHRTSTPQILIAETWTKFTICLKIYLNFLTQSKVKHFSNYTTLHYKPN